MWGGGAKDGAHHPKRAPPRSPAPPRPVARHSDAALSQRSAELKQPLMQFTQQFNETANLISSAVVGAPSVGERAALLTHFVAVGVELRALRNFNGVNAVLAGLSNSAVHRMKCAKERLSNKTRADWEGLQRLMSCGGSYKHYRAALAEVRRRPPFIPYLGVHLTDLVMLGEVLKLEGGPSKAEGKVNLTKRQQVHASIALCLAGRGARYGFAALPGIARMVEGASHMSEEQLYDASLAREPRGSCLADLEKIDAERVAGAGDVDAGDAGVDGAVDGGVGGVELTFMCPCIVVSTLAGWRAPCGNSVRSIDRERRGRPAGVRRRRQDGNCPKANNKSELAVQIDHRVCARLLADTPYLLVRRVGTRLRQLSVGLHRREPRSAATRAVRNQSRACHCLRRRRAACGLRNTIRGWWRRRAHFHALVAPVLPSELTSRACAAPTAPPTPSAR